MLLHVDHELYFAETGLAVNNHSGSAGVDSSIVLFDAAQGIVILAEHSHQTCAVGSRELHGHNLTFVAGTDAKRDVVADAGLYAEVLVAGLVVHLNIRQN